MAAAAALFYNAADVEKQTLHRRIVPTEVQFEEQTERWNNLADHLTTELQRRSGYPISTWLQGSYKFGTQVRGARLDDEFDIDLGVYYRWAGASDDGNHRPKELKELVQQALGSYQADGVIDVVTPPKDRCCRIRFVGNFHIDVPAYHLDPSRDQRQLATQDDAWEDSDPKALYLWFRVSFENPLRAKVRREIRYFKIWASLKFKEGEGRPSSTLITVLVTEAFAQIDPDLPDDETIAALLDTIIERLQLDRSVPNPVEAQENLAARLSDAEFDTLLLRLKEFQVSSHEALGSDDLLNAADKWSEPFEYYFALPDPEELEQDTLRKNAMLPITRVTPEIAVEAVSPGSNKRWLGNNEIGPIPKECDIYFRITNPEVLPPDHAVNWMVRNEGDEAEYVNDLGHRAGMGLSAKERSAYRGSHYMDCIVKQHGRIIGQRRVPVTITGTFWPRRNPVNRPGWVKLRGRR